MMKEIDLEEVADQILREYAKREGKSMRQIGIVDERRERTIRSKEITLSYLQDRMKKSDG